MKSILSFYRDIYAQELSHSKTMHLYSTRVLKRFFISKEEEVLNDENPYIPIGDKYGEEIVKTLELKSSEVQLKYYSFARISRFVSLNKFESTRIYPLFSYNASVVLKKGEYYLHINKDSREVLKNNIPKKVAGRRDFKRTQISPLVDFHFAANLAESIQKGTPKADVDELLLFPKLWSDRKIKGVAKKAFVAGDQYIPIGTLAIVEKENSSFTTLDELNKIVEENELSAPLSTLFGNIENRSEEKLGIICEELNKSQLNAIFNSNEKIVSVVSGPPGTGKSFTIANLAAEKVSKGQSILITSKNKEALDVIENKIKSQLGIKNLCVNPSQDQNFAWMKDHLDFVLGRQYKKKNITFQQIQAAFESFQKTHDIHLAFEKELMAQFQIERDYAKSLDHGLSKGTTKAFRNRIFKTRAKTSIALWESLDTYYERIDLIRKKAVKSLHRVNTHMLEEGIKKYRKELREYLSFLRARDRKRKKALSKKINYDAVLKAFPVWLVRANDISKVLPLQKEAFDILIIDEASQCDIPSIIPLMQRAKKVVIVGDTKQLTHISFISKAFESTCRAGVPDEMKHLCQHRDRSILHLVEDCLDPQDRVQLNEHFRSQFPIIAFSNDQFYQNRLDILTKRPISVAEHVQFVKTNGKRTAGYNADEAKEVLTKVREIINSEVDLPKHLKTTIGILSPFRKQVDHLFSHLIEGFAVSEIKAHRIIVGTAFTFQGNERDVMFLSLSLDDEAVSGSFTFLNRKDVFNVSITRARNVQYIYHSFSPSRLKTDSTTAYFFRFYDKNFPDDLGRKTKDEFCLDVAAILNKKGLKTWTNFGVSGVSIDLLTQIEERYIGIDLIGFPGEMEEYYSLERYKMIERGKIKLFPLSYPLWMGDRAKCTEAIMSLIEPPVEELIAENKIESEKTNAKEEKKPRRKYRKFDLSKMKVIHHGAQDENELSIRVLRDDTVYGRLWLHKRVVNGTLINYLMYDIKARYTNKGLEEMLLDAMNIWLAQRNISKPIFTSFHSKFIKDKEILQKYGFIKNYEGVSQNSDDLIRLVRFPTDDERKFYSEHAVAERMGEKIYMQTFIPPSNKGISFKMKFNEATVGSMEVDIISAETDEGTVYYRLDSNFVYIGLEERLFEALNYWQKSQTEITKLVVNIPQTHKDDRMLFERYGFVKANPYDTLDKYSSKKQERFVKAIGSHSPLP